MSEEQGFSLGNLDEVPDYVEQENQEVDEQEELHSEDVTDLEEESDYEESTEVEELDEEESEQEELDDDSISYTPFVEDLLEDGVLYVDPEKEYDDTPEGFQEIIADTVNHRFEETISQLPEVLQQVIELAQLGEDPYSAFENLNPFDYSSVDLDDVDTQRELTKDYLLEKFPKWSEDRLAKELQNREDLDELKELAEEAQAYFVEKTEESKEAYLENTRLAREEALRQQEEQVNQYRQIIEEADGFAGINFTSNQQKANFDRYCFEKGEDGLTQYERDSKNPNDALTLAWYRFNKFGFESIEKKARSSAYVEQKKVLARYKDKNTSSNATKGIEVERPTKGFKLGKI